MKKKYLLCYIPRRNDGTAALKSDTYHNFEDAVKRYTLLCAVCSQVVLSDTEQCRIIYQYIGESSSCTNQKLTEELPARWKIELIPQDGRYEYEDLSEGEFFSLNMPGELEFYVHHIEERGRLRFLSAVCINNGSTLAMKGESTVYDVYDKKFVCIQPSDDSSANQKTRDRFSREKEIELIPREIRYTYDQVPAGDVFSIDTPEGPEFFVKQVKNQRTESGENVLAAVSLHTGKTVNMKGERIVTVYNKNFL